MSESENKAERDPNGFLNCQKLCISTSQQCSRRYLTVVGFENHVKVEHSDLNRKQTEEQQDANCVPSYLAHAKIHHSNSKKYLSTCGVNRMTKLIGFGNLFTVWATKILTSF